MDTMFWVWLGVIAVTAIIEFITCDLTSIWFTCGAVIPFIISAFDAISWEWQLLIFVVVSALLMVFLRKITRKLLLKNANFKSNVDGLVGKHVRMISRADFETVGSVKIGDVVWSAVALDGQSVEANEVVEVVGVDGNKLQVKKVEIKEEKKEDKA